MLSEQMKAVEAIRRLQWAHNVTYKEDVAALFREVLAAPSPLEHLRTLTFAYRPETGHD